MNLSSPAAVSALLKRHHFQPAHKFGQNFLVDANILAKIVAAGELEAGDSVLEIGTGLGVLTRALAEDVGQGGTVATVERDPRLGALHAETLSPAEFPQVRQVHGDVLEIDLDSIIAELAGGSGRGVAVVANIPYNITSPLIGRLLERATPLRVIVLLVQKEVGERLAAKPGTPDYGAFTVFSQFYAQAEMLANVSPNVFFPPPKVTSAIMRLRPRKTLPVEVSDPVLYFKIVRASFGQRRKTILNALSSEGMEWTKEQALSVLTAAAIDPQRRGETLSQAEFASLERSAQEMGGVTSPRS